MQSLALHGRNQDSNDVDMEIQIAAMLKTKTITSVSILEFGCNDVRNEAKLAAMIHSHSQQLAL